MDSYSTATCANVQDTLLLALLSCISKQRKVVKPGAIYDAKVLCFPMPKTTIECDSVDVGSSRL